MESFNQKLIQDNDNHNQQYLRKTQYMNNT